MLKNYLAVAWRNLRQNQLSAFLNLSGLALGIACALLIHLYNQYQLSYDHHHPAAERVFRVLAIDKALGVSSNQVGICMPAVGRAAAAELPEVELAARAFLPGEGNRNQIAWEDRRVQTDKLALAEPELLQMFDLPLEVGTVGEVLKKPNTGIIRRGFAEQLFGKQDPIGKRVTVPGQQEPVEIIGVLADPDPAKPSHIALDMVVSLLPSPGDTNTAQFLNSWNGIAMNTYLRLRNAGDEEKVEAGLEQLLRKNQVRNDWSVTLQPLLDVHLKSNGILYESNAGKSDIAYVHTLYAVAGFILLIAAFNFMNLSTARSARRAREVGVRKVLGADRRQLILQLLTESILMVALSSVMALLMVAVTGQWLNLPLHQNLALYVLGQPVWLVGLATFVLGLGLLAGSYPALVLSGFQPIKVLKGNFRSGKSGIWLRRSLVVVQFAASILMIIGTLTVKQQLAYIRTKNLGFERENRLAITLSTPEQFRSKQALVSQLGGLSQVNSAAGTTSLPGDPFGRTGLRPEGMTDPNANGYIVSVMQMDEHYLPTMGIKLVGGRNFERASADSAGQSVIINQALAKALGYEDPVGRRIFRPGRNGTQQERRIVGVVEDFHFASMRHQIEPLMMTYSPQAAGTLIVHLKAGDLAASVAAVEGVWKQVNPGAPFEFRFLDQHLDALYRTDQAFAQLVGLFAGMAIFIACLGLFGLVSFASEQRTKEIGVRKVMGATVPSLMLLLSKEFLLLVAAANVIAWPLAWWLCGQWLSGFAYKVSLGVGVFLLAGMGALVIAVATTSWQAWSAAQMNPVKSLKSE